MGVPAGFPLLGLWRYDRFRNEAVAWHVVVSVGTDGYADIGG